MTDQEKKWEAKFEEWWFTDETMRFAIHHSEICVAKEAYLQGRRDGAKERQEEIERLKEALREISEGKGRYDMDNHQHAINTIEDMKALAIEALKKEAK